MSERREPPAPGPAEPERSRLPGPRRVSARGAWALALGGLGLVVGVVVVSGAWRVPVGWVQQQGQYQLEFGEIDLQPPPPPWIGSGKAGLLDRVRAEAGRPATLSALAVDLRELEADFQRCPWVEAVEGCRVQGPNRVVVRLRYREPVARIELGGGADLYLDRDAVVLPPDVDPRHAPTIPVQGLAPAEARAGVKLVAGVQNAPPDAVPGTAIAVATARFAAFLRERAAARPAFRVDRIYVRWEWRDPPLGARFWLYINEDNRVHWGPALDDDPADAEARWANLDAWYRAGHDRPFRTNPERWKLVFVDNQPELRPATSTGP